MINNAKAIFEKFKVLGFDIVVKYNLVRDDLTKVIVSILLKRRL